ncbi:MAG TPA: hypothetical protein VFH73_25650 [Polyangia bacterium]|nr:hypothetical protein [Polyangia bacterium]
MTTRALRSPALAGLLAIAVGCSGSGSGPGGTGGSGGAAGTTGTLAYRPCPASTRVGQFSIQLIAAADPAPAYAQFAGRVRNAPDPTENWREMSQDGACRLVIGPELVCSTPCTAGTICAGQNQCINEPVSQDIGVVSVGGLATPLSATAIANSQNTYYASLSAMPYPPFSHETPIRLSSAGGAYAAFTLQGRGVVPLDFAGTGLQVIARDKALPVTWTAPAQAGSARIFVRLDIGHHGGYAARVECDVADTGSMTIPAGLITQLIGQGTAGFPTISLTRQTVDSTTVAPGCVEFAIASPVERPAMVEGIVSCSDEVPCPAGKTCKDQLRICE